MKVSKTKYNSGDDKIIISSEYYKNDRISFICSVCSCTLSKLTDSSGQNPSFYCTNCSIEYDPEFENLRRESKISTPDRNQETLVSNTLGIPDISIHHEPEINKRG